MSDRNTTAETARQNAETAANYRGPQKPRNPDGSLAGPPPHEDTLGALAGVPKEVAEEYAKSGHTPKAHVRQQVQAVKTAAAQAANQGEEEAVRNRIGVGDLDAAERGSEEETFAGKPLGAYDGIADDQLDNEPGVGPATAKEILKARRARDRKANRQ